MRYHNSVIAAALLTLPSAAYCQVDAVPAQSQSAPEMRSTTGSRILRPVGASLSNDSSLSEEDNALRTLADYAACLVERDEKKLRPMLSLGDFDLPEETFGALAQPRCLSRGELKMDRSLIRGAIFREFLFEDFGGNPLTLAPTEFDYFSKIDLDVPGGPESATVLSFASCVVRAHPEDALTFVTVASGDPRQSAALNALLPQLGPCLRDDLQMEFKKRTLLAYLSEALYWEAKAGSETHSETGASN